jgi:hypothetical protein
MKHPRARTFVAPRLFAVLGLLAPTAALAQPADPAAPAPAPAQPADPAAPAPPAAEPAAPATPPVAEPAPPPPAEAAPPVAEPSGTSSLDERITTLEGQLEGMNEPFQAMQTDVANMKKLKFSGYIQGRYQWTDDSDFGVTPNVAANTTTPRNNTRFLVRRARLKTTYRSGPAEAVLQIDAIPEGVSVRDAEASLVIDNEVIPASDFYEIRLTVGQFKTPFGFEVLQSSGDREAPERTRVVRALFPGERDRGLRLQARTGILRFQAALINGNGTQDTIYNANDQTSWKDLAGRFGLDLEYLVVGVSGYWGRTLSTTVPRPLTNTSVITYQRFRRVRVGADAQAFYDVPGLGGLTLRGEVIWGRDTNIDFAGMQPNACRNRTQFGWYGTLVQNIGDYAGAFVRYDEFDPSQGGVDDGCMDMMQRTMLGTSLGRDKVGGLTVGLLGYLTNSLELTVAYEHLIEHEAVKKDNDIFTTQLQARF